MIEVETTVREWGGSQGITLPKDELKKAHIKPGDKIRILILPKKNPLKETAGTLTRRRPMAELHKEVNEELE